MNLSTRGFLFFFSAACASALQEYQWQEKSIAIAEKFNFSSTNALLPADSLWVSTPKKKKKSKMAFYKMNSGALSLHVYTGKYWSNSLPVCLWLTGWNRSLTTDRISQGCGCLRLSHPKALFHACRSDGCKVLKDFFQAIEARRTGVNLFRLSCY